MNRSHATPTRPTSSLSSLEAYLAHKAIYNMAQPLLPPLQQQQQPPYDGKEQRYSTTSPQTPHHQQQQPLRMLAKEREPVPFHPLYNWKYKYTSANHHNNNKNNDNSSNVYQQHHDNLARPANNNNNNNSSSCNHVNTTRHVHRHHEHHATQNNEEPKEAYVKHLQEEVTSLAREKENLAYQLQLVKSLLLQPDSAAAAAPPAINHPRSSTRSSNTTTRPPSRQRQEAKTKTEDEMKDAEEDTKRPPRPTSSPLKDEVSHIVSHLLHLTEKDDVRGELEKSLLHSLTRLRRESPPPPPPPPEPPEPSQSDRSTIPLSYKECLLAAKVSRTRPLFPLSPRSLNHSHHYASTMSSFVYDDAANRSAATATATANSYVSYNKQQQQQVQEQPPPYRGDTSSFLHDNIRWTAEGYADNYHCNNNSYNCYQNNHFSDIHHRHVGGDVDEQAYAVAPPPPPAPPAPPESFIPTSYEAQQSTAQPHLFYPSPHSLLRLAGDADDDPNTTTTTAGFHPQQRQQESYHHHVWARPPPVALPPRRPPYLSDSLFHRSAISGADASAEVASTTATTLTTKEPQRDEVEEREVYLRALELLQRYHLTD